MLFDYETLKLIWWGLIGTLLIGFAITDGMDMGVGSLLPFVSKTDEERRVAINTIGAHWDGNQVWFITAGGALFAAWPTVYATAFSGFYFAMMLVLFTLFLRPLAFDYRSKLENSKWRQFWDWGLFVGSSVPAFVFGVAFGNLLQGVPFHFNEFIQSAYTGSFFALLNPFSLLAGVLSWSLLAMHGGIWLQMRAADDVGKRAAQWTQLLAKVVIVCFVLAGLWVAFGMNGYVVTSIIDTQASPNILAKTVEIQRGAWLHNYANQPLTLVFPVLGLVGAILTLWSSQKDKPAFGFFSSSLSIIGVITTAGVSMFPFVMPSSSNLASSLTVWDAVSSPTTLNIMLIVTSILLPIVLSYTLWCYIKMWRKVTVAEIQQNPHSTY